MVENKYGNNKKLKDLLKRDSIRYKNFQFSILYVLHKTDSLWILIKKKEKMPNWFKY